MTVGELRDMLAGLPHSLPILIQVEQDVQLIDAVNERIHGRLDASFCLKTVDLIKTFSLGKGWHTAVSLVADEEI